MAVVVAILAAVVAVVILPAAEEEAFTHPRGHPPVIQASILAARFLVRPCPRELTYPASRIAAHELTATRFTMAGHRRREHDPFSAALPFAGLWVLAITVSGCIP